MGAQKPGFWQKYCVTAERFGQKPGFFGSRVARNFGKKPGFFSHEESAIVLEQNMTFDRKNSTRQNRYHLLILPP